MEGDDGWMQEGTEEHGLEEWMQKRKRCWSLKSLKKEKCIDGGIEDAKHSEHAARCLQHGWRRLQDVFNMAGGGFKLAGGGMCLDEDEEEQHPS
jgi:hypothetical protein